MHARGERGADTGAPAGRIDVAGVGHEIVSDFGRRRPGDGRTKQRDELIGDVLMERAERYRGSGHEIALDLDVEMRRPLGLEPASRVERRESALRWQPDAIFARRQELLRTRRHRTR